jgi:hypothetical protein
LWAAADYNVGAALRTVADQLEMRRQNESAPEIIDTLAAALRAR